MNIFLLDSIPKSRTISLSGTPATHIIEVLQCKNGDVIDVGVVNGKLGKGTVISVSEKVVKLSLSWGDLPDPLEEIVVIVGLPRPQTARKILNELTALGASSLEFVHTERSTRSYAQSRLWTSGEWQRHVIRGAEQAFTTMIPDVKWNESLHDSLATVSTGATKIALDNYEGVEPLSQAAIKVPLAVAVGPERGWSAKDRRILRTMGFRLMHLGSRVLRVETACVTALAIAKSKLGMI